MTRKSWLLSLAALLLSLHAAAQTPHKQIRVIVDTSASLHDTDPSGYVKLSTELLYDLARHVLDTNDTFRVAHFPPPHDVTWPKTKTPPDRLVETSSTVFTPDRTGPGVDKFHDYVRSLAYTSEYTYFSPCIQWALSDLDKPGSSPQDNRVIVLITDGKPDSFVEPKDKERLENLAKVLRSKNIRVFVLAFGKEADEGWFNQAFGFGSTDGVKGQVFAGADTGHLLPDMLQIFSMSFGYSKQILTPGTSTVDIAGDNRPEQAAVVALYHNNDSKDRPAFGLGAPIGQSLGTSRPETENAVADPNHNHNRTPDSVSYAYQWLDKPSSGLYRFEPNRPEPVEIAVLRPITVEATIRSYQGGSTSVVMAGKPTPMEVVITPANATSGDPGKDVRIRFYQNYFKPENIESSSDIPIPPDDPQEGRPTPEGRVYIIQPNFSKDPAGRPTDTPFYQGYIDVEVTQYDTPIYRMGERAHPVRVYPFVSVGVSPNPVDAKTSDNKEIIAGGHQGCVSGIQFFDHSGLEDSSYTLALRVINPNTSSGAWKGARFTFDGKDLSTTSNTWQMSESVTLKDMQQAKHNFCIIAGTPTEAASAEPLNVHFGLWRNGADQYEQELNIVDDLVVHATIAAPDLVSRLTPWLVLLLSALLAWLALLLLRAQQTLAPDFLTVVSAPASSIAVPTAPKPAVGAQMSVFTRDQPVFSLDGGREVGRISPSDEKLFVFRPGSGFQNVTVRDGDRWRSVNPEPDGSLLLAAGVTYRAGTQDDLVEFRLAYSQQRPAI